MTEEQILNLRAGDKIHIQRFRQYKCREWVIDFKIDKYQARAVRLYPGGYYSTWIGHETQTDLELVHSPEECQVHRE
jgi:hypothetical protein